LKLDSPDILHKTEAGVVRLNLRNEDEVRAAYDEIHAKVAAQRPAPRISGILVQKMLPRGLEIMVGARNDPVFGMLLLVGLGGIFVELLKDTAVARPSLDATQARAMLESLKGAHLLTGFRGMAPVSLDRLVDVICRLSELVADHGALIEEIDINPLICAGEDIVAVDALIVRRSGA
jgi:acyl-CoA synthetase (NDP forming)